MRHIVTLLLCWNVGFAWAVGHPSQAGIATAHPVATQAGFEIFNAGGNAFDAAVAVSATLAVVEPYSSGIGGGGFWLLHRAQDGMQVMIDGRERAPLMAHERMYQDKRGEVIKGLSIDGPLAAGIPGVPAALVHIAKRYGRLPLSKLLVPAIRIARKGFVVTEGYRRQAKFRLDALRKSPAAVSIFLYNNMVPPLNHVIKQPDLARTLESLALQGVKGFYAGPVAQKLVSGTRAGGGIWTLEDLRQYKIVERRPVTGNYRGYSITSASPPSSGGVALITMLNILSGYDLKSLTSPLRKHLMVEAMRRAYRDRAEFLGDTDHIKVPMQRLLSLFYAKKLRASIHTNKATPSKTLSTVAQVREGPHTTHFSILDTAGNRVAATLSINYPFGACYVPNGTGVLLNDEMDDFSVKPGVPNVYGLIGAKANAIVPGKRMLSSMSPTFVENDQRLAIIGTPGGSRIITMVLQGILSFIDGDSAKAIVSRRRFHHQYLPDIIQFEPHALSLVEQTGLRAMEHTLKPLKRRYGNMQVVIWDKPTNRITAASDPRGEGMANSASVNTPAFPSVTRTQSKLMQ